MTASSAVETPTRRFNLHESRLATWNGRAEAAISLWKARVAKSGSSGPECWQIADLGCGDEKLRHALTRAGIAFKYFGYDTIPQTASCQQIDLAREVPNRMFDVVFCLGVVEYLADVPGFLSRLRAIGRQVILSYVVADAGAYTDDEVAAKGWLTYFTSTELKSMFAKTGLVVTGETFIDEGRTGVWLLEPTAQSTAVADYSLLTPYPIPPALREQKIPNVGDGFIEKAIADLLAPHRPRVSHSTRVPLADAAIDEINETKMLVIVGANQLNDHYTISPEMTPERLARIRVPIVPAGIGIHGVASYTRKMSSQTKELLGLIHERIRYSSLRCPESAEYLLKHCPELAGKVLMTGCPVGVAGPLVEGRPFSTAKDRIVVTVTERHNFWRREASTIDFVSQQFPDAEKWLSLHQVYPPNPLDNVPPTWRQRLSGAAPRTPARLHDYARERGFRIFAPASVAQAQSFYQTCDLHIGSRLHAHLFFLRSATRSFLSYVDDRSAGMARAFDFPICDPRAWGRYLDYDFERCRHAARRNHLAMARFRWSLLEIMS